VWQVRSSAYSIATAMTHLDARCIVVTRKRITRWLVFLTLLLSCGFLPYSAQAQTPDASPILGQITGNDISVTGPSQAAPNSPIPAIEFRDGATIVVHSGKARVDFVGGGELDICGPAKFTVLSSGEALTIALSFGRVHLRVDALRPISIYSPLVLATPMPIGDRARDATVGLTNNGAMCVLASSGAVRLQNQLSGETVIVPQPAEVFVPNASFATLPPATGQCRCEFDESTTQQSAPATPATPAANSANVRAPQQSKQLVPSVAAANSVPSTRQETPSVPQPLNAPTPNNPPTPPPPSSPPPAAQTATTQPLKIKLPPIGYDASSATETAEPLSVATLMLAQQAVVQPEWTFHGTVIPSGNKSNAAPSATQSAVPANWQGPTSPGQPKKGFWARLRAFVIGSSSH
jgi:hypothetical protein